MKLMFPEWANLNLYSFSPQIMQKSENRAIHVCIFNDGSHNDKETEVLDQSTVNI